MIRKIIILKDLEGIHARNSAKVVMACRKVRALVTLEYGGQTADGGNILEVMSLGARYKDQIAVTVDGERETEILEEIERALNGSK
ncbi:MAG: HPr family phosphocarrier protein [Hungatella sp.]|jgi:phosphotransferase system HPr (HPr) family protein|nr:HPr family phosphocarrier protein [Hungatella sp.]MCI9502086.1 HPr family phosphocarrier protein [Hungatella sp.]MCI9635810.1 HPr family phosphocarrier protein [Hungatella sp.]